MNAYKKFKIAYIHGRLGPHIMHGRLAKSVDATFFIIDQYKRWNDGYYNKLYIIYAWVVNAFAFKPVKKWDIFLVSGPHFSPIIMKFFRLRRKQKVLVHLGDETMYFLYDKWYGKLMQKVLVWLLNQYDALLCEGQMAADLAVLNGIKKPKIYTTYLGVPKERQSVLLDIKPNLASNNFITICTGPTGWREYYKGLDLMLNAFSNAFEKDKSIVFTIVGEWDEAVQNKLTKGFTKDCLNAIHFVGHTNDIDKFLNDACFYYHTSRGDAFPTTVLEAMSTGLIPLVSEWTGSKEVVSQVSKNLIVPIDEKKITNKLLELSSMELSKRETLSEQMKKCSTKYTEEFALDHYRKTFDKLIEDFQMTS